jgi:hypothetical protein
MWNATGTPTIGDALIGALPRLSQDVKLPDILRAAHSDELQEDPEGVFAAWLAEVPGAQDAAPALLEALRVQAFDVVHPNVASANAALNAYWALKAAMGDGPPKVLHFRSRALAYNDLCAQIARLTPENRALLEKWLDIIAPGGSNG